MDADTVKRLNAEYARLQRELDERDMARMKAASGRMEDEARQFARGQKEKR